MLSACKVTSDVLATDAIVGYAVNPVDTGSAI